MNLLVEQAHVKPTNLLAEQAPVEQDNFVLLITWFSVSHFSTRLLVWLRPSSSQRFDIYFPGGALRAVWPVLLIGRRLYGENFLLQMKLGIA